MTQQYQYLFTPLKVGSMTLKNRIFFGAHGARFYSEDQSPNDRAIEYYTARAKGGAGMMELSGLNVAPVSTLAPLPAIQDEKRNDDFKRLADSVHQHGMKIIVQLRDHTRHSSQTYGGVQRGPTASLYHLGSQRGPIPFLTPHEMLPGKKEIHHEMDLDEIKMYVDAFASAARLMKKAGIDGFDLNSWCMNLNALFLSPQSNCRKDKYGGNLENRNRFNMEVLDAIRAEVGPDFPVGMSIDGDQMVEGGITQDDAKVIAQTLEATGKVNFFRVGVPPFTSFSMYYPLGPIVYLAAGIKEVVKVPVICVSRINDPIQADKILADGHADIIQMVRGLICDPEFPNKAREGRLEEIRRCIACNERCRAKPYPPGLPVSCAINPEAGREKIFAIAPVVTKKKVMVIGGGAAGLEVARVATLRGHKVTLYEQEKELGGQLNIAAKAPGRSDFAEAVRYYTYQMKHLGVDVRLNTKVTEEMVLKEKADAVVVATGSLPFKPALPGSDQPNVVEVRDVLEGKVEVGNNVVILAYEDHNHALSTADFLAERGKKVEILVGTLYAGAQMDLLTLSASYASVLSKGVILTPLTEATEIRGNTVIACNVISNIERRIEGVDNIVMSTLGRADDALYRSLKGKVKEVYAAGHCMAPRMLADSVLDGAVLARRML